MRAILSFLVAAQLLVLAGCGDGFGVAQLKSSTVKNTFGVLSLTGSGNVRVYRSDRSLSQFPDGGGSTDGSANAVAPSVSLAADQSALTAMGVQVVANSGLKLLSKQLPFSLPIPGASALRGGNGSLVAGLIPGANVVVPNLNPNPVSSGVMNSYEISPADVGRASGFAVLSDDSLVPEVACGNSEAIIAFGQSNSANSGGTGTSTDTNPNADGVLMFYNGHCFPARDPLLGSSIWAGGASVWLALGKLYVAQNPGKKIILVTLGIGSSGSWEWAPGGQFANRLNSVLSQTRAANLNVTKIYWHQGETDGEIAMTAAPGQSASVYLSKFRQIKNTLNATYPAAPIYTAIGTYVSSLPYFVSREIEKAQFDLITENYPAVRLGAVSDYLAFPYRSNAVGDRSQFTQQADSTFDDVHYSYSGLQTLASAWYAASFGNPDYTSSMYQALIQTYLARAVQGNELAVLTATGSVQAATALIQSSDEYFVRDTMYRAVAHRLPESDGLFYWLDQVRANGRDASFNTFANAVRNIGSSPNPSQYRLVNQGSGWWGSAFNYLAPIHDAGPFHFNQTTGVWEVVGQASRLPPVLGGAAAMAPAAPVVPVALANAVDANTRLNAGQSVSLAGGSLVFQGDGNLVFYSSATGAALWATSYMPQYDQPGFTGPTQGYNCGDCYAVFQTDGNLVLYSPTFNGNSNHAYWASGTGGQNNSRLVVAAGDPFVSIVNTAGAVVWNSHSSPAAAPAATPAATPSPAPAATQQAPAATPAPAAATPQAASIGNGPSVGQAIAAMYFALESRNADRAGYDYWAGFVGVEAGQASQRGATQAQFVALANEFVRTAGADFNGRYGGMNNDQFARAMYRDFDGSEGDAGGIAYWKTRLDQGVARSQAVGEFAFGMLSISLVNQPAGFSTADWSAAINRQNVFIGKTAASLAATGR